MLAHNVTSYPLSGFYRVCYTCTVPQYVRFSVESGILLPIAEKRIGVPAGCHFVFYRRHQNYDYDLQHAYENLRRNMHFANSAWSDWF